MTEEPSQESVTEKRQVISLRGILVMLVTAALVPVAVVGWLQAYRAWFEISPPQIHLSDVPRGIGLTPVSFQLNVSDSQSGLRDVVVQITQRNRARDLLRQTFHGEHNFSHMIELDGETLELDDAKGPASIEIYARDQSIWKNHLTRSLPLNVDFRKPHVELISSPRTIKAGGSQLFFYSSVEENSGVSGIKVNSDSFFGERASGIDHAFENRNLYAALFTVTPQFDPHQLNARVFSEDQVGNADSLTLELKVNPPGGNDVVVDLEEDFLRSEIARLADQYLPRLQDLAQKEGRTLNVPASHIGNQRLVDLFSIVNGELRAYNTNELQSFLTVPRSERYWKDEFLLPAGKIQLGFGDRVTYRYEGQTVGSDLSTGLEIATKGERDVKAANGGIVILSDNLGVYGRVVAIDHGFGLISIYGRLEDVIVQKGMEVNRGQKIGSGGTSGFARFPQVYFELRLQGVPVDPLEWTDAGWFYANISERIDEAKRHEGLPVAKSLL